jgi:hypothetical protein
MNYLLLRLGWFLLDIFLLFIVGDVFCGIDEWLVALRY